jgi:triacylglycerol lipase
VRCYVGIKQNVGCLDMLEMLPAKMSLRRELSALAEQSRLIARRVVGSSAPPSISLAGRPRVVFVHGFMAAGPIFDPMRAHVEETHALRTIDFTYGPMTRFEDIAQRLARVVDDAVREGETISVVGHSMGGLLARWYMQELGGASRVDKLITLATPHGGTHSARLVPGPLASSIRPGSSVLKRLRETRDRTRHIPHFAIVAGEDFMVTPPSSAADVEDAVIHWYKDLGHNEMLYDVRIRDLVTALLGK